MLSKHFKKKEFACKCGCGLGLKDGDVNPKLVEVLEDVRTHFGKPVVINSGLRCKAHNKKVGGEKASQHLLTSMFVQTRLVGKVRAFLRSGNEYGNNEDCFTDDCTWICSIGNDCFSISSHALYLVFKVH